MFVSLSFVEWSPHRIWSSTANLNWGKKAKMISYRICKNADFFFFKCPCASENLLFIFALGSDNSLQMYVMIREISLKGRGLSESLPPLAAFVCVYVSKKMACIIFLWALRFILFCCQTFGNAFYKLYWDKISRGVCIFVSSAQYYFLMHFWLCMEKME